MKAGNEIMRNGIALIFFLFMAAPGLLAQETGDMEQAIVKVHNDKDIEWGPCPDFMPERCNVAVLHGDPTKKNSDIFFRIPENAMVPNHTHTSAERMVLVSGEMQVTYEGEDTQTLREGSYAYGPAQKAHTARCVQGPCVLFIAFEEPVDAFAVQGKN
jgi:quercetin dioxygenase-like cupin family protein